MIYNSRSARRSDETDSQDGEQLTLVPRMFVFEGGWKIGVKTGGHREFCHSMAPGQEHYHRLVDGEIFLVRDSEKVCLPCAGRRGLIATEPKTLRDFVMAIPADLEAIPLDIDGRR
jgi:hypothetical protein